MGSVKGENGDGYEAETGVDLDRRAMRLFNYLRERAGQIVSQETLLEHIWPDQIVHQNSLHQAIIRVRKAVEHDGTLIEAIYGKGYRLILPEAASVEPTAEAVSRPRLWPIWASIIFLLLVGGSYSLLRDQSALESDDETAEAAAIDYLSDDLLNKADPYSGKDYDPAVRPVVERVIADADKRFAKEPAILAKLHYRFGSVLSGWGQHKRAYYHMNRAAEISKSLYGRNSAGYINARAALCEIERLGGDLSAASAHCAESTDLAAANGDPILQRRAQLAQAKLDFENGHYRKARDTLQSIASMPVKEASDKNDGHSFDADTLANANWFYALSSRKLADYKAAETGFKRLLAIRLKQKGRNHPHTAWALSDYGDFLVDVGRYTEAYKMLIEAKQIFSKTLGAGHPDTYSPDYSIALIEQREGHAQEAAKQFDKLDKSFTETLGADHLWTLYTRTQLALSLAQAGNSRDARILLDKTRPTVSDVLYEKPEKLSYFQMCWAETLFALGDRAAATTQANAAKSNLKRSLGESHPWMKRIDAVLAGVR